MFSLGVLAISSAYLLVSFIPEQSHQRLPGDKHACMLLQSTLALGPNDKEAGQIQHSVLAHYVSLAKRSRTTGDARNASVYSSRALDVLVGSWVDADQRRPEVC